MAESPHEDLWCWGLDQSSLDINPHHLYVPGLSEPDYVGFHVKAFHTKEAILLVGDITTEFILGILNSN